MWNHVETTTFKFVSLSTILAKPVLLGSSVNTFVKRSTRRVVFVSLN